MCVECYKRTCWRLNNCPLDRILCFTGNEKLRTKDEKCTPKDYVSALIFFKTTPTSISKSNKDDPCSPCKPFTDMMRCWLLATFPLCNGISSYLYEVPFKLAPFLQVEIGLWRKLNVRGIGWLCCSSLPPEPGCSSPTAALWLISTVSESHLSTLLH